MPPARRIVSQPAISRRTPPRSAAICAPRTSVRPRSRRTARRPTSSPVAAISREHVEAFVTDQLARWRPATAANRYRGLQRFFVWLVDEGELRASPMARMRPPHVPEAPPPVLADDELKRLLATCERGAGFEHCRDAALIRVFIDTGARRAEVAGLRYDPADETANDVDLDQGILRVVGKGRRERVVAVGSKTVRALDRYLRGSETTCIPTGCAIRSRTAGWPGVAARPI